MTELFSLRDKVVLVTGSTRGLGWHMALAVARAGGRLVLHGRTEQACKTARETLGEMGFDVDYVHFPMEDHDAVGGAIDTIVERHGAIWGVVNNAGMGLHRPIEDETVDIYGQILAVHAVSPFQLTQHAARHMKAAPGPDRGRIVNVSSIAFSSPRAGICNYATAKAAIVGFTRAAGAELGPHGICCNAVAPGYFRTENTEFLHKDPRFRDKVNGRTPAGRWGDPAELAAVVQFLLSPASSYVNAQCLGVDGGMSHYLHAIDHIPQN